MNTRSIFLFKVLVPALFLCLGAGILRGANQGYLAIFSAEEESLRRLLIDGVGERRVRVKLDSLGQAEVTIYSVDEQTYVGRRAYEKGYLVPVAIRVEFPRKNIMSIKLTGTRFWDFVRYKVMDADLYVIDFYTHPLPRESYFREETISALWPNGRFQPDITPATPPAPPAEAAGTSQMKIPRTLAKEMAPYRRAVRRAVVWAGSLSGILLLAGIPLVWFIQRRRSASDHSASPQVAPGEAPSGGVHQSSISDAQVRALMTLNGSLSYDEASLLAAMGGKKSSTGLTRSS
ncbi:MAG: hypothetical protein JSU61_11810 [Fidelibacterota bacterium]|nr:MAG: hypothetical protein JSU61_11810 [Candidatus Neomarinimicrobiota bacterium]